MIEDISRRDFLYSAAALATTSPLLASQAPTHTPFRGTLCFFSKPVPQLNWRELAASAKKAGFGGIDLTVRPGGHVLPERVATDLPKAVADIRAAGLEVPMITTGLLSADDPAAEPTFRTASKLSIPYLKPGYYRYTPYLKPGYYPYTPNLERGHYNDAWTDVVKKVDDAGAKFRTMISLAAEHGIQVGYHITPITLARQSGICSG